MPRVRVAKSDPPETMEVMAQHIASISRMAREMRDGRLAEEAVVILLHHKTKVPMKAIRVILNGLRQLESWYLKREKR